MDYKECLMIEMIPGYFLDQGDYSVVLRTLKEIKLNSTNLYLNDSLIESRGGFYEIFNEKDNNNIEVEYNSWRKRVRQKINYYHNDRTENVLELPFLYAGREYSFKVNRRRSQSSVGNRIKSNQEEKPIRIGMNYNFKYTASMETDTLEFTSYERHYITDQVLTNSWNKIYRIEQLPSPELTIETQRKDLEYIVHLEGKLSDGYEHKCSFMNVVSLNVFNESVIKKPDVKLFSDTLRIGGKVNEESKIYIEFDCKCPGDVEKRRLLRVAKLNM